LFRLNFGLPYTMRVQEDKAGVHDEGPPQKETEILYGKYV